MASKGEILAILFLLAAVVDRSFTAPNANAVAESKEAPTMTVASYPDGSESMWLPDDEGGLWRRIAQAKDFMPPWMMWKHVLAELILNPGKTEANLTITLDGSGSVKAVGPQDAFYEPIGRGWLSLRKKFHCFNRWFWTQAERKIEESPFWRSLFKKVREDLESEEEEEEERATRSTVAC